MLFNFDGSSVYTNQTYMYMIHQSQPHFLEQHRPRPIETFPIWLQAWQPYMEKMMIKAKPVLCVSLAKYRRLNHDCTTEVVTRKVCISLYRCRSVRYNIRCHGSEKTTICFIDDTRSYILQQIALSPMQSTQLGTEKTPGSPQIQQFQGAETCSSYSVSINYVCTTL